MKHLVFLTTLIIFQNFLFSQEKKDTVKKNSGVLIGTEIYEGDTISVYILKKFKASSKEVQTIEEKREMDSLVRNVRKVLPYAKLAAFRLQLMEDNLKLIKSERAKKKYIKECEKSIKEQFVKDLQNLYDHQGRLLLKLIHRETGKSSWDIMKGYTGVIEAAFWQVVAKSFKTDMNITFDPVVDYKIEEIIRSIEAENAPQN